ncbi:hypothetical protein IEQ34_002185 [Dendrobium chrysotoxum]|uniref:Reverse transcriptase domain-containing protein n=1 Tax=Dendrobium chrysotoxum TaxID=161865 RepID=A0AAV7HMQ6_DENCH|nr:hypothetical protein IEQ34_002185 [Dendrobium chrysotoxum]
MAFASLIHRSSVQIPLRFESGNSRARTSLSSSIHFAYSSMRRAGFSSTLDGGRCCQCIPWNRMQCFKETSQEDFKLEEDLQIGGHQSCDEDGNIKNAASDTSLDCQNGTINRQSSIRTVTFFVLAAVTFGIALGLKDGLDKASEYFAGYILEQSLSVDNLFVFILIFNYFKVPIEYQSRVLSYGIAGAIIFRAIIILLGVATIQLFFAEEEDTDLADNFIVRTCQKFIPVTAHYDGDRFITIEDGVWKATPLLLTVAVIELSDIAFAVDSIPAVFGVTRDPFIVFSSNLFAISEDVPWCMLFADDILIDKTREGVEGKLELWRSTLESKGFRLSRSKTEYMECNFSSNRPSEGIVTLSDQVINKSTHFRYLGSIVQSDDEIDGDIISRIQVGWLKWRNASGLLCDRKVPLKLKGKFYKLVVRPAMLYGVECWPLKEKHNTKLSVAEMRMLRWMSSFTLRDRIRNEHIREKVGVAPVEDKIRESRLRWFGHIKWWPSNDPVRKVEVLDLTYVKKGLRSIYTLISGSMSELEYLQPAIGIVLGFIGVKMIFDFFGYHITTEVSLGFVATSISSAVLLSLVKRSNSEE